MNDDFEQHLQSLHRRPLPAEWKAIIMRTARPSAPSLRPPRWLAWGMAAAWCVVGLLHVLTPSLPSTPVVTAPAPPINSDAWAQQQQLFASLMSDNPSPP